MAARQRSVRRPGILRRGRVTGGAAHVTGRPHGGLPSPRAGAVHAPAHRGGHHVGRDDGRRGAAEPAGADRDDGPGEGRRRRQPRDPGRRRLLSAARRHPGLRPGRAAVHLPADGDPGPQDARARVQQGGRPAGPVQPAGSAVQAGDRRAPAGWRERLPDRRVPGRPLLREARHAGLQRAAEHRHDVADRVWGMHPGDADVNARFDGSGRPAPLNGYLTPDEHGNFGFVPSANEEVGFTPKPSPPCSPCGDDVGFRVRHLDSRSLAPAAHDGELFRTGTRRERHRRGRAADRGDGRGAGGRRLHTPVREQPPACGAGVPRSAQRRRPPRGHDRAARPGPADGRDAQRLQPDRPEVRRPGRRGPHVRAGRLEGRRRGSGSRDRRRRRRGARGPVDARPAAARPPVPDAAARVRCGARVPARQDARAAHEHVAADQGLPEAGRRPPRRRSGRDRGAELAAEPGRGGEEGARSRSTGGVRGAAVQEGPLGRARRPARENSRTATTPRPPGSPRGSSSPGSASSRPRSSGSATSATTSTTSPARSPTRRCCRTTP